MAITNHVSVTFSLMIPNAAIPPTNQIITDLIKRGVADNHLNWTKIHVNPLNPNTTMTTTSHLPITSTVPKSTTTTSTTTIMLTTESIVNITHDLNHLAGVSKDNQKSTQLPSFLDECNK